MKILIQCGDPGKLIDNLQTLFYFPERYLLHPRLQVNFIDSLLRDKGFNEIRPTDNIVYIITNSDHIINRCRVAKKEGEIEELEFHFYPFDNTYKPKILKVDKNGEISEYPKDFLEEWGNQLCKLL